LIDLSTLQHSSCIVCRTSLLGDPSVHLASCEKQRRCDDAIDELMGLGYESLSLEQIGLLFDFLLTTDLSGCFIADVIVQVKEGDIVRVMCPSCNDMVDAYSEHNCARR